MRSAGFCCLVAAAAVAAILPAGSSQAALLTGLPSDVGVFSTLTGDANTFTAAEIAQVTSASASDTVINVGASGSNNHVALLVFELPSLAPDQQFDDATLTVNRIVAGGAPAGHNADLYAIGLADNDSPTRRSFYVGGFGGDPTAATPLHDNFLSPGAASEVNSTAGGVGAGAVTLAAFLNATYVGNPDPTQRYLFLRLNPDAAAGGAVVNPYFVSSGDDDASTPTIEYTLGTIPEPAMTLPAAAIAGGMLLRRRGRRDDGSQALRART